MTPEWAPVDPGERVVRSHAARTLSLLPAVVGGLGVVALVLGAVGAGLTDGSQGWPLTVVAAGLVAVAVITGSGSSYGLYAGLAILAIGGLVVGGGPSLAELVSLVVALGVVHELVRFSLDARRPTRFGPGVVWGFAARSLGVIGLAVAAAVVASALVDRAPTAGFWVPLGVVAASVPLFVPAAAGRLEGRALLDRSVVRGGLALVVTVAVVTLAVVGAQARSQLGTEPPAAQGLEAGEASTTTTLVPDEEDAEPGRPLRPWVVGPVVLALILFVVMALRRDEADVEMEDVDRQIEDRSFDVAVTGLADTEDDAIEVDDDALTRLLLGVQPDMAAEPDPARAIRFGYAGMEQRLGEIGLSRADAETEREYLFRALPRLGSAGSALTSLTDLFERARFGHDPIDESMRQQALQAVDELLQAVVGDPVDRGGGTGGGG